MAVLSYQLPLTIGGSQGQAAVSLGQSLLLGTELGLWGQSLEVGTELWLWGQSSEVGTELGLWGQSLLLGTELAAGDRAQFQGFPGIYNSRRISRFHGC